MLKTDVMKIVNQSSVSDVLKALQDLVKDYKGYTFQLGCTFLCNAGLGDNDFEITKFDSSVLPTTDDGLTLLRTEIVEYANKARDEFSDFEVQIVKNISVTFMPGETTG